MTKRELIKDIMSRRNTSRCGFWMGNPDKETAELFQNLKSFVERIPAKAFKPYYTTDFRIMTGRYYRVTVSKCGWLVEDYLSINK